MDMMMVSFYSSGRAREMPLAISWRHSRAACHCNRHWDPCQPLPLQLEYMCRKCTLLFPEGAGHKGRWGDTCQNLSKIMHLTLLSAQLGSVKIIIIIVPVFAGSSDRSWQPPWPLWRRCVRGPHWQSYWSTGDSVLGSGFGIVFFNRTYFIVTSYSLDIPLDIFHMGKKDIFRYPCVRLS